MKDIREIATKTNEKEYDWTKTVIVSISTILGLLVSLKSSKSGTNFEHLLFSISISLFGLSILSGLIYLYTDTQIHRELGTQVLQQPNAAEIIVKPGVFFSIKRYVFFFSTFLSLISLVAYAILKDS